MPILHLQFNTGQKTTGDGNILELHPSLGLLHRGPCIQVSLSIPESISQELIQLGEPVPSPITGLALIDTGASHTSMDDGAAKDLGLPVIDVAKVESVSHTLTRQNIYPLSIEVVGHQIKIAVDRVVGANLAPQGLVALIGRDFLQHCTLYYNGLAGSITLSL